ncbi:MAG: MBL fold metallo-hydrolase [Methanomassiliicoccales archaeon]|nr:MAG: MBL fold metallo-hydrolase [Methanomassiliicoccales archaeon]
MPALMIPGAGYDSNIVVVPGRDPFIVDTGTGIHSKEVIRSIERILGGNSPSKIILTHMHFDHVGGASELSEKFSADVFIHEVDAASVESGDSLTTAAKMFGRMLKKVGVKRLKDGDIISNGSSDFTVIHTPGHTAGSICLFEPESRTLISGDTVFVGGVGRWDLPTGNRNDLGNSVKNLLSKKPKDLYPGHGPAGEGLATEALMEALEILGDN